MAFPEPSLDWMMELAAWVTMQTRSEVVKRRTRREVKEVKEEEEVKVKMTMGERSSLDLWAQRRIVEVRVDQDSQRFPPA